MGNDANAFQKILIKHSLKATMIEIAAQKSAPISHHEVTQRSQHLYLSNTKLYLKLIAQLGCIQIVSLLKVYLIQEREGQGFNNILRLEVQTMCSMVRFSARNHKTVLNQTVKLKPKVQQRSHMAIMGSSNGEF